MGNESKNNGGAMQIPAASKKVVQSIKEIVSKNCTDAEIYSVLCDHDMDAVTAIQKLLSQDTFQQVKSKRERRKEMKETQELKARSKNNGSLGAKAGGEFNVGCVPSQISYNDLGKAAYRKENGLVTPPGLPSSTLIYCLKTTNEQLPSNNDSCNADDRRQTTGTGDAIPSSAQLSSRTLAACSGGTAGHVSMANIVRMGRPHNKGSQIMTKTSYAPQDVVDSVNSSQYCCKPSCDSSPTPPEMHQGLQCSHPAQVPETIHKSHVTASSHDEWPVFEQQTAAGGSYTFNVSDASSTEMFSNPFYYYGDGTNLTEDHQLEEVQVSERDAANKNSVSYCAESAFSCRRQENVNSAVADSCWRDDLLKDTSYDSRRHMNDHQEGQESRTDVVQDPDLQTGFIYKEKIAGTGSRFHLPFPNGAAPVPLNDEVSSAAVNLQQLSLGKEEPAVPPSQDNHAILFPKYMQALAADCSHLSFGTYKPGAYNAVSEPLASTSGKTNLEEASGATNGSSPPSKEIRNPELLGEYLRDQQLGSMSDAHRLTGGIQIHNRPVFSQPELTRQSIHEVSRGHEYTHPSSVPDSNFKKTQALDFPLGVRIHPKAKNLSSLHMELQASSATIPMDLLASTIQSSRDSHHAKSSFLGTQSMPSRFGSTVSLASNQAICQSEALSPMSYSPTLPVATLAPQPALSKHLSANSYSQPPVSLEELTNLTGYPAIAQNYAHNPSAFQQAYQDNSVFRDSLSSMGHSHPQRKTVVSRSSLPLSDVNISGYRGFGSTANFPGAILQAASPSGSAGGYDILLSRHQERNNFITHHQNGGSSRMMPALPDNGYFSLPGQGQLLSGYPQGQQLLSPDHRSLSHTNNYQQGQQFTQDYGALFHANAYHSQARIPPEQPHQSLSDLNNYNNLGNRATNGYRLSSK